MRLDARGRVGAVHGQGPCSVSYSAPVPRPGNPDIRRRLLASGLELFYARGVNATGVKEIADRADVPKAAFYTYYESKEAFVVAVLEQYWLELQDRSGSLLLGRGTPVRRLQRYFAVIADEHEHHTFMRGCLIGNLALEVSATSASVHEKLRGIVCAWEHELAAVFTEETPQRRREVAGLIIEAWEGAVLRARIDRTRAPYDRFSRITLPQLVGLVGTS